MNHLHRSFRSIQALIRHVDEGGADHEGVDREELAHYKLGLMSHPLLVAGLSGQVIDSSVNDLLKNNVEENNSEGGGTEDLAAKVEASKKIERLFGGPSGIVRKADKSLTYPLEKYLDPNRPYKCDVCKESFTQKNILLVHYNSVSHLHKLKKTMQENQQQQHQPQPPPMHLPERGSLESAISNLRKDDGDEASKPYKCNICKVAYSQGSTLDIHIRSVLHQTRASKLQELALSGQIDLSRPLIEQPDPKLDAQKKTLTEMLSPKSLNSSGSSNPQSSPPTLPQIPSSPGGPTPHSSPLAALGMGQPPNQPGAGGKSLNDLFASQDQLQQQQQQLAKLLQVLPNLPNLPQSSPAAASNNGDRTPPGPKGGAPSSHVLKGLLQNYGFELVMQFNEYHQRKRLREEEERRRLQEKAEGEASKSEDSVTQNGGEDKKQGEEKVAEESVNGVTGNESLEANSKENEDLPEVAKSKCPKENCGKEFSSIWVLKAHSEEIHKEVVPPEFLDKYVEELKSNLEKKGAEPNSTEATPAKSPRLQLEPKTPEVETPPPQRPEVTSTPKSGKTTPTSRPSSRKGSAAAASSRVDALTDMQGLHTTEKFWA